MAEDQKISDGAREADWPPRLQWTAEGIAAVILLKGGGNANREDQVNCAELIKLYTARAVAPVEAERNEALAAVREFDRLSLAIESAVRRADPDNLALIDSLIDRVQDLLEPKP